MAQDAEKWAGDFSCNDCGRKRLTAAAFSKKTLEKLKQQPELKARCKDCTEAIAAAEREAAAKKAAAAGGTGESAEEHECCACKKSLRADAFNRNQLSKGPGKQRCRECVAVAEEATAGAANANFTEAHREAKKAAAVAEATGNAATKLQAHAALAALEAQHVTGLKPVVLGRGRGGKGSGRSWRGAGKGGR